MSDPGGSNSNQRPSDTNNTPPGGPPVGNFHLVPFTSQSVASQPGASTSHLQLVPAQGVRVNGATNPPLIRPPHLIPRQQFPAIPPDKWRSLVAHVADIRNRVVRDFIPHPLSPAEVQEVRHDTVNRIRVIHDLEASLSSMAPATNERLQQELFMARLNYQTRFFRIFRINDLPHEILTNIFRYVAWSAPDRAAGVKWRLWLTWTCKHWRTITLNDPTLWSAIWFRDSPPFDRSFAWFDRAGSAPLDLRIGDHENHQFSDGEIGPLLDRLFTKASTIRMFIATLKEWDPVLVILDKFRIAGRAGIPITLERFELHRTGTPYVQLGAGYQPSAYREPMALFGGVHVTSLKYFSINGVHLDWNNSCLANLTTIDLRRMPLELSPGILQFRDMLSGSPSLRKLCLDGAGPRFQPNEAAGLPPVHLDHLKILVVADFSVHYARYILSHISARNVRDLTVLNLAGEDYSPLFAMITSRFPEVRILTVYSVEIVETVTSGRTIVKWLESMPLLAYLRIANVKKLFLELFLYDPQTFQHLKQEQPVPRKVLCPQLSFLECQAVDPDMIVTWGTSRRELRAPLSKIYVSPDWAKKITREQHAALLRVAPLFILDRGKAIEEDVLMN